MLHGILKTDELLEVTGYNRRADLERCLTQQGVRYFWGKDGPWTTLDLINAAGGLKAGGDSESYQEGIL